MPDVLVQGLRAGLGLTVLLGVCYACSSNRRRIDWKLVGAGLGLQIVGAALLLAVPMLTDAVDLVASFFVGILNFTRAGSEFLFGSLLDIPKFGYIFAFQVLPTIVFFSALTSILYYLGILQRIVFVFAWIMSKTMRLSGAESLAAAANIFIGQTEAPLVVKPYIERMTRSELLCLMTGGMATIAGAVFAAYVGFLGGDEPALQLEFARQLLTASIISAPAAIVCAKILIPEDAAVDERLQIDRESIGENLFDATALGTTQGVRLAVNVGAMLLVFTALVTMISFGLERGPGAWFGLNDFIAETSGGRYQAFTLQSIFGFLFAPVAWLIGVDSSQVLEVGQLLGEKLVINEFYAYATMGNMLQDGRMVPGHSAAIATFALCGFANVASMGIQVGGIAVLAPSRRVDLSTLAPRALLAGTVACLMTACVAGVFL